MTELVYSLYDLDTLFDEDVVRTESPIYQALCKAINVNLIGYNTKTDTYEPHTDEDIVDYLELYWLLS